jgi:phosphoribosylamine---glycine ligase
MAAKRRVVVLGAGGREHALAWALARSASVGEVVVAPGNAGCSQPALGSLAPIRREALSRLEPEPVCELARALKADLVVVGPEVPLCRGVVDALDEAKIPAFGPSAAAARLEGSKAFMKRFAAEHDIPTAPFLVTTDLREAERYIDGRPGPQVVKADGLAAGKGAVVTSSAAEAKRVARRMLVEGKLGPAGRTIVVEDRLPGRELSVHVVSDGDRYLLLPVARDHKRLDDHDEGPNTGGMGAVAPIAVEPALMERIEREVIVPTLAGMKAAGSPYRGVLYAGLMVGDDGTPYLLEHNVRFGDPETQVLMALVEGDLFALFASAAAGALDESAVRFGAGHAIVVVLAADGYPGPPRKGDLVTGLEQAAMLEGVHILHAGTDRQGGALVTDGGRVLGITAVGPTAEVARDRAYRAAARIKWPGVHYRRDIGAITAIA